MKIAVLGNCQSTGLAQSINRWTADDCFVKDFEVVVEVRQGRSAEIASILRDYDIIFAHEINNDKFEDLSYEKISKYANLIKVPSIVFTGFQPDIIHIHVSDGVLGSPLSGAHSAIIAGAFAAGIPEDRVGSLFNKLIYRRLGYLGEFERAATFLDSQFSSVGQSSIGVARRLLSAGSFMYTVNHPSFMALDRLGELIVSEYLPRLKLVEPRPVTSDHLRRDIWPVYPEIAQEIGVPGNLDFVSGSGQGRKLSLSAMIEESYTIYRDHPDAVRVSPRVTHTATVLRSVAERESPCEASTISPDILLKALYASVLERGVDPQGWENYLPKARDIRTADELRDFINVFVSSAEGTEKLLRRTARSVAKSSDEAARLLRSIC